MLIKSFHYQSNCALILIQFDLCDFNYMSSTCITQFGPFRTDICIFSFQFFSSRIILSHFFFSSLKYFGPNGRHYWRMSIVRYYYSNAIKKPKSQTFPTDHIRRNEKVLLIWSMLNLCGVAAAGNIKGISVFCSNTKRLPLLLNSTAGAVFAKFSLRLVEFES